MWAPLLLLFGWAPGHESEFSIGLCAVLAIVARKAFEQLIHVGPAIIGGFLGH